MLSVSNLCYSSVYFCLLQVTSGYFRLLQVTSVYFRLLLFTSGYFRLLQVTSGYFTNITCRDDTGISITLKHYVLCCYVMYINTSPKYVMKD